jgi:hypothetical protein
MRITVRGWGRDQGETGIMDASLGEAQPSPGRLTKGETYLDVQEFPDYPHLTKVRVLTSTEVRLGGSYVLQVEISRKEIAQLFYKTHDSEIVRMFRSFVEDEEKKDLARKYEEWREERAKLLEAEEHVTGQ